MTFDNEKKNSEMIALRLLCLVFRFSVAGGAVLLCVLSVSAQQAVSSVPMETVSTAESSEQPADAEAIGGGHPAAGQGEAIAPPVEPPSRDVMTSGGGGYSSATRRFHYKLEAEVSGVYDDNINFNSTDKVEDYYFSIAPRAIIGLGDMDQRQENFLRLEYAPHVLIFADHSDNNAFEQAVHAEAQYRFDRLQLRLSQDVEVIDSADIAYRTSLDEVTNHLNLDVSGRTRLNSFATNLVASYDLSSKTFVSVALTNSVLNYVSSSLLDSQTTEGALSVNYRYSTKLVVGVGAGGGIEVVDPPTPDQTFANANVRVLYQIAGKFVVSGSVGVEVRQFDDVTQPAASPSPAPSPTPMVSSRGEYVTPILEAAAIYRPFPGTDLRLSARRRTQSSASLAGQDYSSSNIDISARQRLFRRFVLGLAVGYQNSEYFDTVDGLSSSRSDDYYYFAPSLDVLLTRYWSLGGYYLRRQNDTTDDSFTFRGNQVGVRTAVAF